MQLVNRTINGRSVDQHIRSEIDRTFTSSGSVPWSRNVPVLFQGLDCAYETVQNWLLVQHEAAETNPNHQDSSSACASVSYPKLDFRNMALSDIIVERKSEFLGHAIRISSPDEVCT